MNSTRTLVLFDFDGTITKKDTLLAFTKFVVGDTRFYVGLLYLSVPLVLQKLGLLSAHQTKELFLAHFFHGKRFTDFEEACQKFSLQVLPDFIRQQALEAIDSYLQQNCQIVIVSASPQNWITPWANQYGIDVIATKLEVKDDHITGKISGVNCNGYEKVKRIKEKFVLEDYDAIIAYGDTKGDNPMLKLATQRYFKPFRDSK